VIDHRRHDCRGLGVWPGGQVGCGGGKGETEGQEGDCTENPLHGTGLRISCPVNYRDSAGLTVTRRPQPPAKTTAILALFPPFYCSGGSPLVRFLARSISVTATRISARVLRSGASSMACFSAGP